MRKRKVFALLLALSMAMSTNGMVVYADEPAVSVETEESSAEQTETGVLTESGQSGDASDGDDQNGDSSKDSDQSKDENGGGNSDQNGQDKDAEDKNGEDDKEGQTEITEMPVDSDEDDGVTDEVTDDAEEISEEDADEVRMETFTDETGMTITYDAVMATSFDAEVRAGTLYAVPNAEGVLDLREESIETIDSNAFKGNTDIKYIMLPKTVKSIGAGVFEGCGGLKGISIPSRLTTIGNNAFKGCTSLTQLALPNSVTSIGESAFQGDSRLFMLHMVSAEYSKLRTISKDAFNGCSALEFFCSDDSFYLPDSITTIGENSFEGCRKLTKVSMSDKITSLGTGAFQKCTGLTDITLSSGLETIPENAFAGCSRLVQITFGNSNMAISTKIASNAFANCIKLGSVELPEQITTVSKNAFVGCTSLKRVYVKYGRATLEDDAFPNQNQDLCLVATAGSTTAKYADKADVRFVSTDEPDKVEYYRYKSQISGTGTDTGKISLKVTAVKSADSKTPDINTITNGTNAGNGVKAGTLCYLAINYGGVQGIKPVAGSVKCNGTPLTVSGEWYSFSMPIGGATITAEFEMEAGSVLIAGDEDSVEGRLSSDSTFVVNSQDKSGSATLKVGQSTKFYLTDSEAESGSRIPTSKVTYYLSKTTATGIVSIDKDGTVKALKEGTAVVCADVKNISGVTITRMVTIKVEQTKIDHISMLVPSYDKNVMSILTENEDSTDAITGISIPTNKVTKNYTFDLKAVAFSSEDDDEAMAVAFTWATSDAKIAKLSKTSTTAASSVNTITIPINTDGEATITVTATNADKTKVTQTFVVRVENYAPRLASSKITVNPNQKDGTELEIISAYGKSSKANTFKVVEGQGDFTFDFAGKDDTTGVSTYKVKAREGLPDKTYAVKIEMEVENTKYQLPLSIVVKKSVPNPKVAFASTQQKMNLFYANEGIEFKPVVSNLGDAEVSKYSLEPLTEPGNKNYENDVKFIENFKVEKDEDGNPVITQQSAKLACNTSNKPVVAGYLVLKFKGYNDDVVKKYKITIPTQTVAPSYVLNVTANTFGTSYKEDQIVYLQLLDNKNKKAPIKLNPAKDKLVKWNTSTTSSATCSIVGNEDPEHEGMIKVIVARNPEKGRLVMKLTNSDWTDGKEFLYNYQVNTVTGDPKISLKTATVTLNTSYPEQSADITLVSNQYDTKFAQAQVFDPVNKERLTTAVMEQYEKLDVSYENGEGKVSILDSDIKAGTYKFTCAVKQDGAKFATNNVTLNVKVTKTVPTVTLKGTNNFNLMAYTENDKGGIEYVEKSEMTLTTKNLPDDYTLDSETTLSTIECTTKGYDELEKCFEFGFEEDKLIISMREEVPAKTYAFKMLPTYEYKGNSVSPAKYLTFNIKVYNAKISVKLGAKGKLNLLNRVNGIKDCTEQNGIRYTPTFTNLKDTLEDVVILDASGEYPTYDGDKENNRFISQQFEAKIAEDGKSFFVVPKAGVELENKKSYQVRIWMKTQGYAFPSDQGGIYAPSLVKITTAEVLPKVKADKTAVDMYLSNKSYETSFVVSKADLNAAGEIKEIVFGEKDDKANNSFEIRSVKQQKDGSLRVYLKLKNTVSYSCNTTNKITMYIKFMDQGRNTAGTAVNMSIKINK